jgi:hypothetical protein
VRNPEEAMIEAADSRISVRRVPSAVPAATPAAFVSFFPAARRFDVT